FFLPTSRKSDTKPFSPGQVREFALQQPQYLHPIAFNGNTKLAASAGADKTISLWDTATGKEQFRLPEHKGPISHLALSPNGRCLASGTEEEKVWKLWDLNDQREHGSFTVDKHFHVSVPLVGPFSADGKYVLCQNEGTVSLVEVASKKTIAAFPLAEQAS